MIQPTPRFLALAAAVWLLAATPGLAADAVADADLLRATYDGDLRGMQAALRAGASFNARDENGYTPLHWAAFRGYVVLAGYMLDRGASVDVPDANGYTPLMLAGANGHDTVVRLLRRRGASRERQSRDGWNAWDYARGAGHASLRPLLAPPPGPVPTPRPSARPTSSTSLDEPAVEAGDPLPEPEPLPTPVPTPATELPLAAAPVGGPANGIEVVAGMHLSKVSFPIIGVHYRRVLVEWLAARVGAEYGRTDSTGTGALPLGFTRLHAALLTNTPLYAGLGATHITLGTLYAGGFNPSALSVEAIGGLRLGAGPVTAGAEVRFGVGGPSTVTGGLGLRF